ncbi:hypothetical protein RF11_08838 [Thelohanellus kitauei]|uniref:Uncharacterized protein n=1 Tax=Thelohanellus kitauei TaxID=669202 RepID=A0A0C2I929_THEKT|nr:hypothetical protein RF11_08838 [Thelohanellus kitauei]
MSCDKLLRIVPLKNHVISMAKHVITFDTNKINAGKKKSQGHTHCNNIEGVVKQSVERRLNTMHVVKLYKKNKCDKWSVHDKQIKEPCIIYKTGLKKHVTQTRDSQRMTVSRQN